LCHINSISKDIECHINSIIKDIECHINSISKDIECHINSISKDIQCDDNYSATGILKSLFMVVPRMLTDENTETKKSIVSKHLQYFSLEGEGFLGETVTETRFGFIF
jgi:hypothetical protein